MHQRVMMNLFCKFRLSYFADHLLPQRSDTFLLEKVDL
jgi:hypothetical protein